MGFLTITAGPCTGCCDIGVCCTTDCACDATMTQAACESAGGTWVPGVTCDAHPCVTTPLYDGCMYAGPGVGSGYGSGDLPGNLTLFLPNGWNCAVADVVTLTLSGTDRYIGTDSAGNTVSIYSDLLRWQISFKFYEGGHPVRDQLVDFVYLISDHGEANTPTDNTMKIFEDVFASSYVLSWQISEANGNTCTRHEQITVSRVSTCLWRGVSNGITATIKAPGLETVSNPNWYIDIAGCPTEFGIGPSTGCGDCAGGRSGSIGQATGTPLANGPVGTWYDCSAETNELCDVQFILIPTCTQYSVTNPDTGEVTCPCCPDNDCRHDTETLVQICGKGVIT